MSARPSVAATIALTAQLLAGCAGDEVSGPPDILLGEHVCDQCNMIISDERFASASLVIDEQQRTEYRRFDDLNCLLNYESAIPAVSIVERWVHDHTTLVWLNAQDAAFLHSEKIHTPMGSNVASHATMDDATAHQSQAQGQILDLDGLVELLTND